MLQLVIKCETEKKKEKIEQSKKVVFFMSREGRKEKRKILDINFVTESCVMGMQTTVSTHNRHAIDT